MYHGQNYLAKIGPDVGVRDEWIDHVLFEKGRVWGVRCGVESIQGRSVWGVCGKWRKAGANLSR